MLNLAAALPTALGAASGAEKLPLIPHIPELIFGFVMLGVVYAVVAKKVVPSIERAYAERRAAIEGGMQQAEVAQAKAAAALASYEAQLSEARAEASAIRERAREEGAVIITELRAQANAESARIADSAKRQVEAERQQAVVQLRQEIGTLSTTLASKIVGESLQDEGRQNGIVARFLAELEAGEIVPERVAPAGQDA